MTAGKLVTFRDKDYLENEFIDLASAPNDEYLRGDGTWQTAATIVGTGLLLDTLGDVNLTTPADDDILTYDSASSKWINEPLPIPPGLSSTSDVNFNALTLTGNLTVQGTTTTVDSTTMTVVDPIMTLQTVSGGGALTTDTNKDVGLAMQYHTGSAAKTAFVGLDDSEGKLTFIPDASITSEVVSGTKGTIVANLEGSADTVAGLTPSDGNFIVGGGSTWVAESAATARLSLGLGSIATKSLAAVLAMTQGSGSAAASTSSGAIVHILLEAGGGLGGQQLENEADTNNTDFILMPNTADTYSAFPLDSEDIGDSIQAYDSTILTSSDIGSTVQAYDSTILTSADIGSTLQAYNANLLTSSDIGSTVQAYNANLLTSSDIGSTVQAYDSTILTSSDIGSTVQAYDAELAAIAGLTSAADKGIQFTGSGSASTYDLTAAGKALLDDADAAAQRTTLGISIGSDVQAYDAELAALAGTTSAADKGIYYTGSGTASTYDLTSAGRDFVSKANYSQMLSYLTLSSNHTPWFLSVRCTGTGSLTLPVGTTAQQGSPVQGGIRYNTTDTAFEGYDGSAWNAFQSYDAELAAIAGLTSAADKGIQFTGSGTASTYDLTAAGKALLDDADAAAQRTTLGLGTADSPSFVSVSATGTGSLKVPVGTTAQQAGSQGGIRYNTTDSAFEGYDGSAWGTLGGGGAPAEQISDAAASTATLEGTYTETMMIADTFSVSGTVTLAAGFYMSKITDDGQPVIISGSGTLTGTGTMASRFPFAADSPKVNRKNLGLGHQGDGIATRSLATAMLLTPTWGKAKQATDFVSKANGGTFDGNIGIGTSPSSPLHLKTTGSTDVNMVLEGPNSTWSIGNDYSNSGYLKISNHATVGTSTAMTFGASGLIGIGATVLDHQLQIQKSGSGNSFLRFETDGTHGVKPEIQFDSGLSGINSIRKTVITGGYDSATGGAGGYFAISTNNTLESLTTAMYLDSSQNMYVTGDVTSGASDERLKENIEPINNAIEKIKQIKGITFDWIDNHVTTQFINNTTERHAGVLAQDVQKVLPEVVRNAPFDLDTNKKSKSGKNYLTVKYEHLVPLLIEAIKEQQVQIDELIQAKE